MIDFRRRRVEVKKQIAFVLAICLLLSFVSIIYAILVGLSFYSSKRQLAADKKYEGKTIEVKEEE